MIIYLINILILTFVWLIPEFNKKVIIGGIDEQEKRRDQRRKLLCVVGTISWIVLSGLRHVSIGVDTEAYKEAFESIIRKPWGDIFNDLYLAFIKGKDIKDPGYAVVEKFFSIFSKDYQLFLVFIALVFFIGMGVFIYRYSSNPYISFILFSTLFYSFFAITGHRQTIATALVVWLGIELIKNKRPVLFVLLALLVSTIHKSALCFIPFYWISKIKINRYTLIAYWVVIICSFIFREQLMLFLQSLVGYESYEQYEGAGAGTFVYLLIIVAVIVSLFHRFINDDSNKMVQISINAMFCACFFSSLLLINQSTMRVVQYFSIFLMVLLPEIEKIFQGNIEKTVYRLAVVVVLLLLLFRNNPTYMFFWQ